MPVTADQIRWCYVNLLGREPESPTIIEHHASEVADFPALVLHFVRSQEFLTKHAQSALVPLDAPANSIETDAAPKQMAQLRQRIREAWTRLGEVRPHHSVLTGEQFFPENIGRSVEVFWSSGRAECRSIQTILSRHGFIATKQKTCVEYGSGLGRVTCALAHVFGRVHGYDISPAHLELARQHAGEVEARNISFHLCSEDLFAKHLEKCDFFYSRIVFQHNSPPVIRDLIAAALASLNEEGIAIFQVPTYGLGYKFSIDDYLQANSAYDMEMHCIPQQEVFSLIAVSGCEALEVREDNSVGWSGSWISNTFVVRKSKVTARDGNIGHEYSLPPA